MDFETIAERTLRAEGFEPRYGAAVAEELTALDAPAHAPDVHDVRDLRSLPWSSIDNDDSLDLDQVEVAERLPGGEIRLRVGIADVDALVRKGSPIDEHARRNATSVYAGIHVYAMLPERLSTDLTSLSLDRERVAMVIELDVAEDGCVRRHDVYRALVRNRAKLAYEHVGRWLEGGAPPESIAGDGALLEQLQLQAETSDRIEAQRDRSGALELDTIEARPVVRDGRLVDLTLVHKSRARELIENFMISANIAIARFLEEHGRSGIRRVVRAPERWERIVALAGKYGERLPEEPDSLALAHFLARRRSADPGRFPDLSLSVVKLMGPGEYALDRPGKDPGGHFGLAAHDYSHATAPNRRYADLVTQRLVKATLENAPAPYGDDELAVLAAHCTEREDAARKVERTMRKAAAALLLAPRTGDTFDAIVTGVNRRGVFVRLLAPPAEGRVVRHAEGMDVGEYVRVRLVSTDPGKGWVDFEGVG